MLISANTLPVDDPERPPRPAVTVGDVALTRSELLLAASLTAEALAGHQRVAIRADASPETVVAVVGALLAGVTIVPVPPDSGAAEIAHILRDSEATAWVGSAPPDPAGDVPVLDWIATDPDARADRIVDEPADPDRIAMIMYTSGTTGLPKGVLLPARALAASLDGLADAWDWTDRDVLVHGLPLFHVHGLVLGLLGPLRFGSPLVHTVKPTPQAYAAAHGSMYFGVPTVWSRVADDPDSARALASARLLISGSAPLPVPVFRRLTELTGIAPIERYGMSETVITISTRVDGERRPGWVGVPIRGVETRLRDEHGAPVPHDGESIGQLHVRGETLFAGYLHRPDATAASTAEDGWFVTGDIAAIDESGFHRIVGRESVDLIKSGGYRIGAGEIETVLLAHPDVAEVAVVGAPDSDLGQRIVAFIVPAAGATPVPATLIGEVAGTLSHHKRPREIRVVESLPRNAMGKVVKKALVADQLGDDA